MTEIWKVQRYDVIPKIQASSDACEVAGTTAIDNRMLTNSKEFSACGEAVFAATLILRLESVRCLERARLSHVRANEDFSPLLVVDPVSPTVVFFDKCVETTFKSPSQTPVCWPHLNQIPVRFCVDLGDKDSSSLQARMMSPVKRSDDESFVVSVSPSWICCCNERKRKCHNLANITRRVQQRKLDKQKVFL